MPPFIRKLFSCSSCGSRKCEITLAIFGVDGAGKTMTVQALKGGQAGPIAPTVGFRNEELRFAGHNIKLYDLGGSKNFRGVWQHYVHEVHGMVYVIDSANQTRLEETARAFKTIITHERFVGKPVLILANKQDLPNALAVEVIDERTKLKDLAAKTNSCCTMEPCSAIKGCGWSMDRRLRAGLRWLCNDIRRNYENINERREGDVKEVKEIREREKEEMRARVKAAKEQREKEEGEQAKRLGHVPSDDVDNDVDDGASPFKPVNLREIMKKEATEKARMKNQTGEKKLQTSAKRKEPTNIRVIKVHKNEDLNISDSEYSDNADVIVTQSPARTTSLGFTPIEDDESNNCLTQYSRAVAGNLKADVSRADYRSGKSQDLSSSEAASSSPRGKGKKRRKKLTPRQRDPVDFTLKELSGDTSVGTLSKVHLSSGSPELNSSMLSQTLSKSENEEVTEEEALTTRRSHRYMKPRDECSKKKKVPTATLR